MLAFRFPVIKPRSLFFFSKVKTVKTVEVNIIVLINNDIPIGKKNQIAFAVGNSPKGSKTKQKSF